MSELPRVDGKQAISAFEKLGFSTARVRGSHHVMKRPAFRYVLTIPVHGTTPLKPGLLRSLIRTAEITVDEFIALL